MRELVGVLLVSLFLFMWLVNVRWNRRFARNPRSGDGPTWDEFTRDDYVLPYVMRPTWQAVASTLGALPLAVFVTWLLFGTGSWMVALVAWLAIAVQVVWAGGISLVPIVISDTELRQGTRRVRHDDVQSIHVVRRARGRIDAYALELTTRSAPFRVHIYITSFSAKDLAILVDAIATHTPTAGLDSAARDLRACAWRPGLEH